jgi:hypothetical protein
MEESQYGFGTAEFQCHLQEFRPEQVQAVSGPGSFPCSGKFPACFVFSNCVSIAFIAKYFGFLENNLPKNLALVSCLRFLQLKNTVIYVPQLPLAFQFPAWDFFSGGAGAGSAGAGCKPAGAYGHQQYFRYF